MTGSVVVETIFGIPGVGRYFVEAALESRLHARDGRGRARRHQRSSSSIFSSISPMPSSIRACDLTDARRSVVVASPWRSRAARGSREIEPAMAAAAALHRDRAVLFRGPLLTPSAYDAVYPDYVRAAPSLSPHPTGAEARAALDGIATRMRARVAEVSLDGRRTPCDAAGGRGRSTSAASPISSAPTRSGRARIVERKRRRPHARRRRAAAPPLVARRRRRQRPRSLRPG